jgi:hypothetical protein
MYEVPLLKPMQDGSAFNVLFSTMLFDVTLSQSI